MQMCTIASARATIGGPNPASRTPRRAAVFHCSTMLSPRPLDRGVGGPQGRQQQHRCNTEGGQLCPRRCTSLGVSRETSRAPGCGAWRPHGRRRPADRAAGGAFGRDREQASQRGDQNVRNLTLDGRGDGLCKGVTAGSTKRDPAMGGPSTSCSLSPARRGLAPQTAQDVARSAVRRQLGWPGLYFGPTTEHRYTSSVTSSVISGSGPAAAARTCSSETNW